MTESTADFTGLLDKTPEEVADALAGMSDDELQALGNHGLELTGEDRRENQLTYYEPVSPEARSIHMTLEHTVGAFGGNGSSKTDSMLVEMLILATGIVPDSLAADYPRQKIHAPGNYRVVVESLTTTLYPIILPKLKWDHWDGIDEPGGKRGHWGWLPRYMLIGGEWLKSWNNLTRILTLANGSFIQFMSYDQDPDDFESGRMHAILHDEPPPRAIWDKNITRVAGYGGTMYLSMTPPFEAGGIPVDWINDDIKELGDPKGRHKDPDIFSVELFAEKNLHLDQTAVAARAAKMTDEKRRVFLYGEFLTMSNLVHPLFTDHMRLWCFTCNKPTNLKDGKCSDGTCESGDVGPYTHIEDFEYNSIWPVVFILDPHPRKPHMMEWVALDSYDDAYHVAELEIDGEPEQVALRVKDLEIDLGLQVVERLIDPNMGMSPGGKKREDTWKDDFWEAGLRCRTAGDNFEVGKSRINEALRPDLRTRRPRMVWHPRCSRGAWQYKRYRWGEWARYTGEDKEKKQKARELNDDYPAMDRYFMNGNFTFDGLRHMNQVFRRNGTGRSVRTGY